MIFKPSSLHKFFFTYICPRFYGSAPKIPATPSATTSTVTQSTIPDQLMPYAKNMLNTAQGLTQQAYHPYSYNSGDYIAPFSPLQQQAQTSASNLQTPGQFAPATAMAGISGLGQFGTAGQAANAGQNYQNQATNPNAVGAYMNPYLQQSLAPQLELLNQQYGIQGAEQQSRAAQSGAFGGTREALQGALIGQNQGLAQQKIISEGYNQAFNNAQNAQQFGANIGLQGLQTAQQGYAGMGQAASQLGQLGTQQLGAETNVMNVKNTVGGQQQAQQQQAIDQSILNYQNAQQYPYMQLGFMSDLIRGTPTGNTTQTVYQAQPGMASQIGGLAATGLGAYTALRADGGVIEDKGYKAGGIVGYKDKGWVEESMMGKLEDLDKPHLQGIIQKNTSPVQTGLAKEVLATKLATGGIVAFASDKGKPKGSQVVGGVKDLKTRPETMLTAEEAPKARNKTDMGIVGEDIQDNAKGIANLEANDYSDEEAINKAIKSSVSGLGNIQDDAKLIAANNERKKEISDLVGGTKKQVSPEVAPEIVKPPVKATPFNMDQAMANMQDDVEKARIDSNKPLKQLITEDRELRELELGPDTATIEYRKKIMDEKANAPDEQRRQMGMRLMEFGANWASTPGAPLVAGMRALKEELPAYMEDTKANKKAMKELDAAIYTLDHATRLENEGYLDRAAAQKQKSQDMFIKIAPEVIDASIKKETLTIKKAEDANTAAYQQGMLGVHREQNAQTAAYQNATLAQPSSAKSYEALVASGIASGMSEYDSRMAATAAQHPRSNASTRGEKALLTLYTTATKDAQAAEAIGAFGSQVEKDRAKDLRDIADRRQLDLINYQRADSGLEPLTELPTMVPATATPVASNNGVKQGWSVTPLNK